MRDFPTDDELLTVVEAVNAAGGNKAEAARVLNMARERVRDRYYLAVRRNLTGTALGGPLAPGYGLGKITSLVKTDGGTRLEWQHKHPLANPQASLEDLIELLQESLTPLPLIPEPVGTLSELATLYAIADLHLGQYSWGKETGGQSYDLDIARDTFKSVVTKLAARAPASHTAFILGLGDFFHADDNRHQTPNSANPLDVDSRNAKVINLGSELVIWMIELALQKHSIVHVRMLPGNHDPRGGDLLTLVIRQRFWENPRVIVDRDPGVFWFHQWGKTMLAAHHGHETKIEQMPGVMAAYEPTMWGNTTFRYAYGGHWHRRKKGKTLVVDSDEHSGAIWEVLPALTAKDAWNRGKGHASGRGMEALTFSWTEGLVDRKFVPVI